jgi:hypothetical protein
MLMLEPLHQRRERQDIEQRMYEVEMYKREGIDPIHCRVSARA